ncbi:MAG: histidinol-phosphatase HisJ family protein [Eggerthellaceae bacterium]|nr:histidinol-phosphatase HisJ family protein [Eggerthellaceae bacterium]
MELINTHCHTGYNGHAEGAVEEYVAHALEAGLTTLAFTDHYPLSHAMDPTAYVSVPIEKVDTYIEDVLAARLAHPELEIIVGCELDYLGADEDRVFAPGDLERFELILGSVHYVDKWPFDDPAQRGKWEEPGMADCIWRRYFELWCEAASDKALPYHVMSHPDLAKKFNHYPSFDLAPLYREAAEAVASSGRMIEVNTSGTYYACAEMFPAPALLREFCRAGVPCTVGADSHAPVNVARDIERGYRLMYEAGYRVVTVPTASGDRRTITIC